jgi:hypothetical protein
MFLKHFQGFGMTVCDVLVVQKGLDPMSNKGDFVVYVILIRIQKKSVVQYLVIEPSVGRFDLFKGQFDGVAVNEIVVGKRFEQKKRA